MARPQPPGRAVRVLRQQHHGAGRGVGGVHPGRRQDQAVPVGHDPGRAAPGHDPHGLGVDGASRSPVVTRPSALLTIFEVTTRMSPSRRSGAASLISAARSAPAAISGSPVTGRTASCPAGGLAVGGLSRAGRPGRGRGGRGRRRSVGCSSGQLHGQVQGGLGDLRGRGQVRHVERHRPHRDAGQLGRGRRRPCPARRPASRPAGPPRSAPPPPWPWWPRRSRSGRRRPCRAPARPR